MKQTSQQLPPVLPSGDFNNLSFAAKPVLHRASKPKKSTGFFSDSDEEDFAPPVKQPVQQAVKDTNNFDDAPKPK